MLQSFETAAKGDQGLRVGLRPDQVLFLGMLALVFGVRVANLSYNSLFVDEAIYANFGRSWLAGSSEAGALSWMYGSYLYPILATPFGALIGPIGMRALSAALSTAAAVVIYRACVRLFDSDTAFWAMLIFGLTAISIDVGQFAVYDAPLVLCLSGALFFVVRAAEAPQGGHRALLLGAGCATLGVLTKYIGVLYLPALVCVAGLCALRQRRHLWPILTSFIVPVALLVGGYAWLNRGDLAELISGGAGVDPGARGPILSDIWAEIGLTSLMALAGLGLLLWRGIAYARREQPLRLVLWVALIGCLAVSIFAAPIYHLALANQHSAWKHTVYSLIMIAPLAGYLCAQTVAAARGIDGPWGLLARVIGLAGTVAIVAFGLNYAVARNQGFQKSWPDVRGAVAYLRESDMRPGDPVLASGSQIYEYYLDFGVAHRDMWSNTWYLRYGGREGLDAMRAAVADRYFRWVILDDYYTPDVDRALGPDLIGAGYRMVYNDPQQTSTGVHADLRIYRRP